MAVVSGTNGDDVLSSSTNSDLMYGYAGNDTFNVGAGTHYLIDEQGNDTYQFATVAVAGTSIRDSGGTDSISFNFAYTLAFAAPGTIGFVRRGTGLYLDLNADGAIDTFEQSEPPPADRDLWIVDFFRDEIGIEPGNGFLESFNGQSGTALLSLNEAIVYGTSLKDWLKGQIENQTMSGYDGDDDIYGEGGNDQLFGGNGGDYLAGGSGRDTLSGDAGNDFLVGDTGNDILIGGQGKDWMEGGAGRDQFVFGEGTELTPIRPRSDGSYSLKNTKGDRIDRFTRGQDKIVLDKSAFKGLNRLTMITTSDPRMDKLSQKIILNRYLGVLVYNQNGAESGFGSGGIITDLFSNGISSPVLTAQDFILVP